MMTRYDLKSRPGRWRSGSIFVRDDETGRTVYEGADVDEVPGLIAELVGELNNHDEAVPPVIRVHECSYRPGAWITSSLCDR